MCAQKVAHDVSHACTLNTLRKSILTLGGAELVPQVLVGHDVDLFETGFEDVRAFVFVTHEHDLSIACLEDGIQWHPVGAQGGGKGGGGSINRQGSVRGG